MRQSKIDQKVMRLKREKMVRVQKLEPLGKNRILFKGLHDLPEITDEFLEAVRYYASLGYTDRQLAKHFHMSVHNVAYLVDNNVDFREAVLSGRDEINMQVEMSFARLAKGYKYPDIELYYYKGEVIQVPVKKTQHPNAYAAYKWLVNRCPERWKDKKTIEGDMNLNVMRNVDLKDFTDAELLAIEKIGLTKMMGENASKRVN
jgi:hypothetical protein